MNEHEETLVNAQVCLKTAREQMMRAARLVNGSLTLPDGTPHISHKQIMASVAANDLAQEELAEQLIETPPPA